MNETEERHPQPPMTGAMSIALERTRQIHIKGYTAKVDAGATQGQLVDLARGHLAIADKVSGWLNIVEELVKAGALIAAEIDRIRNTQK